MYKINNSGPRIDPRGITHVDVDVRNSKAERRVRTAKKVSETNVTGCLLAFISMSSWSSSKIYISLREGEVYYCHTYYAYHTLPSFFLYCPIA